MKMLIKELFGVVVLAGFGGFIRTLTGKRRDEKYNLRIGITEILIAIFAGLLVHWLCREYLGSDNLRTAAIALAGYSARGIMSILDTAIIQRCKGLARFFGRLPLVLAVAVLPLLLMGSGCEHRHLTESENVHLIEIN